MLVSYTVEIDFQPTALVDLNQNTAYLRSFKCQPVVMKTIELSKSWTQLQAESVQTFRHGAEGKPTLQVGHIRASRNILGKSVNPGHKLIAQRGLRDEYRIEVITGLQFELSLIPALPSPHPFCGSDLTGLDCVDADCP